MPDGRRPKLVSGSDMSRKQIGYTVLNGQRVTFLTALNVEIVTGYVYGMDDFHWAVIEPSGKTTLVHKAGTHVQIHPDHTYADEDKHEALDALVRPFREWVNREIFGQHPAAQSATSSRSA